MPMMQSPGFWLDTLLTLVALGVLINSLNPWRESKTARDTLRSRLGFWYALGADSTVLSWIAYGIDLRFAKEPEHFGFPNHPSTGDHKPWLDEHIQGHVDVGRLVEVSPDFPLAISPLQIDVRRNGKRRMCTDLRYLNGFLPHMNFTMMFLARDLSNVVRQGFSMLSEDVVLAYFWVFMVEAFLH